MEDFEFWNTGATPEETQQSLAEDLEYAERTVTEQTAELATLRANLTEARADVARFEAALDAANRELEQARADVTALKNDRDLWRDYAYEAADVAGDLESSRRTIRALVVAARALNRERKVLSYHPDREHWSLTCVGRDVRFVRRYDNAKQAKQSGQQAGE